MINDNKTNLYRKSDGFLVKMSLEDRSTDDYHNIDKYSSTKRFLTGQTHINALNWISKFDLSNRTRFIRYNYSFQTKIYRKSKGYQYMLGFYDIHHSRSTITPELEEEFKEVQLFSTNELDPIEKYR